ncbi:MAG: hypothetical protein LBQ87_09295 [Candidatus Fibromonas sp.]|nr:hypothetical protein [Candidatus Fibromonas sp.]
MKREFKRGISLIAVLMFMLAATTASIVVYKLVGSENFLSGARLKQTEAYQAAESGVDAVHAWLSNKGADVGALVGNYFYEYNEDGSVKNSRPPSPILLGNNILGTVSPNLDKQKFSVYLTGIDKSKPNSIKFKFLSVGEGRDGSTVKLAAIFDVAGLYQMTVPGNIIEKKVSVSDFDYAYFGGTINFMGNKHFSSAVVNGNWTGNPPHVDKDFIVTGDFQTSGSGVEVGDTLCVGGEFNPNNDKNKVGAAYIGSAKEFGGAFGNVYCEEDMNISFNNATTKNLAINGKLSLKEQSSKLIADGNLVIGERNNSAYIDGSCAYQTGNSGDWNIIVCGSVWTENPSGVKIPGNGSNCQINNEADRINKGKSIRFNYLSEISTVNKACTSYVRSGTPQFLSFPGISPSGTANIYKTSGNPVGYFYSKEQNNNAASKPANANSLREYCHGKWTAPPDNHCSDAKYVVNDPIASTLGDIKAFLKDKAGTDGYSEVIMVGGRPLRCVSDITLDIESGGKVLDESNGPTIVSALNQCYSHVLKNAPSKLYGGKYLVMKLNQKRDYSGNNAAWVLDGNFILIYPNDLERLAIAPTTTNSGVMLFLEKGVNKSGAEMKSFNCIKDSEKCMGNYNGTYNSNCPYNYFIYSLGQINAINEWKDECPLHGSLYFPVNSCAGLTNANNSFGGISNLDLVQALTDAKILCKRHHDGKYKEGDCDSDELSGSGGNNSITTYEVEPVFDETYWLPVSSRLKATLVSKKITREELPSAETPPPLGASVLVTPRVIRLVKEAFQEFPGNDPREKLKKFYSLTYLNGAENLATDPNTPDCVQKGGNTTFEEKDGLLPENKVYRCSFKSKDPKYSDFYVAIGGKKGEPVVRLNPSNITLGETGGTTCEKVNLQTSASGEFSEGITVKVGVFNPSGTGWTYNPLAASGCLISEQVENSAWTFSCQAPFVGQAIATFEVCSNNTNDVSTTLQIGDTEKIKVDHQQNKSVINRGVSSTLTIERTDITGTDFVKCPPEFLMGSNWLRLSCTKGYATTVLQGSIWECPAIEGQTAQLIPSFPAACKQSDNFTLQSAQSELQTNIDIAVSDIGDKKNVTATFPFELEWRSYMVTVIGTGIKYSTNARDILSSTNANGTVNAGETFKAYHDAVYTISLANSGKYQANCSDNLACNPPPPMILDYSKTDLTGSVIPTGTGTITLEPISPPTVSCQSVSVGRGSTFRFGDIMPISGYECNMSETRYEFNGQSYSSTQTVPSSATADLNLGNQDVIVKYNCDGRQYTTPTGQCVLNLTGVVATCDRNSTYVVGQTAQRPLITCTQNGVSRTARQAVITVGDVLIEDWSNLNSDDSRPNARMDNAGTIILKALQCGNDNQLTSIDPPMECGVVVAQQSSSSAASSSSGSSFCVQHPSPTPPNPMQKCIKAPDGKCYKCKSSGTNCQNEWFWGGSYGQHEWSSSWPNEGWLDEVSCVTGEMNNVTVTSCKIDGNFGNIVSESSTQTCYNIPRPSIICSDGSTAGATSFEQNNASLADWKSANNPQQFCSHGQRTIKLTAVQCGNTTVTQGLPYDCGYLNVQPYNSGASSCNIENLESCYVKNNPIPRPDVTCPSGTTPGAAVFYITNSSGTAGVVAPWNKNPPESYSPSTVGNNRAITLRSLECSGVMRPLKPHADCGSINIAESSCTALSSSSNTDYCYGVAPNVIIDTKVETTGAVCAKIQGNIGGWNASNTKGRTCRVNGGDGIIEPNGNQARATATSDGYVYIHCSGGDYTYFQMTWWR